MSSEMSEPVQSNPFEKLSDDPILHICSFLRGNDLLKLSKVDKNFNRIITESTETISKIPLVLNFKKNDNLDLDFAINLAQTRRFTALQLKSVHSLTDADDKFKLEVLLGLLSSSVNDLTVEDWGGEISRELLSSIIAMFLPKLKACKLYHVSFVAEAAPIVEEISPRSSVKYPLESLLLCNTPASDVLQFFTGCNQLKTFYNGEGATTKDIEHMKNFLAIQDRLETLDYDGEGELDAAEFLKKLPNLAKLDISITDHPSRRLMKAICQVPKLEKFAIRAYQCEFDDENEDSLEGLANYTVKQLHIADLPVIISKLLKIFLGVESISIGFHYLGTSVLDLSDVPCETIMKIKPNKEYSGDEDFDVKFSPSSLPANIEQFESVVMGFAGKFSSRITGIEIGHESWRNSGAFRLSNSFCEDLVNSLCELVKLKVFNIADRGRFVAFLGENQDRLNLEEVKLYKPFGVGEPKPKKMKINFD